MEQDFKVCAHFQAWLLFLDRTEITLFKIVHFSYTEPWCSCLAHPLSERSSFNSSFFKTLCSWLWTEGLKNRWVEHTSSHHDLFTSRKSKYGCLQQFRALREYLHIRRPPYLKLWPWAVIAYMCDRITASICDSVTQTEGIHWTTEADTERSKKAVSRQQSGMLTLKTSSSELMELARWWPAQCPGRAPDNECCNTSIPLALLIHTTAPDSGTHADTGQTIPTYLQHSVTDSFSDLTHDEFLSQHASVKNSRGCGNP